jgi:hypothetical protein
MNDLKCRSCGATPRLAVDDDGKPIGPDWTHGADCERDVQEERRLRGALGRGENPAGRMWTAPRDMNEDE